MFKVKDGIRIGATEFVDASRNVVAGTISASDVTLSGELRGPATMYIDPAAIGDNTGTLVIRGNLQVDGTTTTINSTTLSVDDLNIVLADGALNGAAANGAGITVAGADATFTYASSGDKWQLNKPLEINSNVVWHAGNLTNLNQLTNGPGYITGYTETDTLATVTSRGASTSTAITLSANSNRIGNLYVGYGTYKNSITPVDDTNMNLDTPSGAVYATTSFRAPIFYDSADTAYYLDPNSYSRINTIAIGNQGSLIGSNNTYSASIYHNTRYLLGFRNSGSGTSNYPWLVHDNWNGDAVILHFNGIADRFRFSSGGIGQADADFRAPIFYDYNDTTYYLDPNSISNLSRVNILSGSDYSPNRSLGLLFDGGNAGITSWNFNPGGSSSYRNLTFYGTGWNGSAVVQRDILTIGNYGGYVGIWNNSPGYHLDISGTGYASSDFRAPIFYDSADTNYYLDPASTTRLNLLNTTGQTILGGQIYISQTNSNTLNSGWGVAGDGADIWINYRSYADGHSYFRNFNVGDGKGTNILWADGPNKRLSINNGQAASYTLHVNGTGYATSDFRAPIFYDSNDTNYYVDPAGNSELKFTRFSVSGYPIIALNNTNSGNYGLIEWTEAGNHKMWMGMGGSGMSLGEYSAYAQDGFSINHDGSGAFTISNRGGSKWIRLSTGDEGNANFHTLNIRNGDVIVNQNAISYSSMDNTPVVGSATTNRLHVNGSIQLTGNNDAIVFGRGTSTFLKDEELGFGWGGGWYMIDGDWIRARNDKNIYSGAGIIRSDSSVRAPIFYDQNDTTYYIDPNSTSVINILDARNTARISYAGYAGIEYYNAVGGQWQGYIGTENNTGGMRYNSWNGTHIWYANSTSIMNIDSTGSLSVNGSEARKISLVLPAAYNGSGYNNLIERINFPWYSEYWDIGVRRGGSTDIQSMEWWLNGTFKAMQLNKSGVLEIYSSNDAQLVLNGNGTNWAGISWADNNGTDYSWFYGASGTWAFGGGGSTVANKKMHIHGGVTIGSSLSGTANPVNGLLVQTQVNAPIFYDSDDTGYYIDPNSTSNSALRMRGGALFGPNTTWGAYLYIGTDGRVGTDATVAVTNGNLHLDSKNGYQMYLNWYSTEAVYTAGNMGIGSASASHRLHVHGTGYATSDFRAPIFYDSDSTGYYCDPAGTSNLNSLYIQGGVAGVANTSYYYDAAIEVRERGFGGAQDDTWATAPRISFHWSGRVASQIAMSSGGRISILNNPGNAYENFQAASIYGTSFIDSDDNNFYLNPASTTTSLQVAGTVEQGNNYAHPNIDWGASGTSTGMIIFYLPGTTSNYGMVHMVFDIYEYNSPRMATVIVGGHNWSTAWHNVGCQVIGYTDKEVRLGVKDGRFVVVFGTSGSSWSYGQIRLRKIQNGSYYNNIMDLGGNWSTTQTTTESFSWVSGDLRGLRTPRDLEVDNTIYGYGSVRSPIFYDYNDTNYYCDPNGTSRLNDVYPNEIYNYGWFRNQNSATGLYNAPNNSHFYSAGPNYWHINPDNGNATVGGLIFYNQYNSSQGNATGRKGYVYWDSAGFGLLDSTGSWTVNIHPTNYKRVTIGGSNSQNPYGSVDGIRLMFGGGDDNASGSYYIGTNFENYGSNYTKLDLRWHTGIRMGAQPGYGGIRFYDTEALGTIRFSINKGDAHTRVESGDFYAANLIDREDSAYYLNPNGTSRLNSITLDDGNVQLYKSQTVDMSNTSTYSTSNYYPVLIGIPTGGLWIEIQNNLNSNAPSWSTHPSGFTLNLRWWTNGSGWGTTEVKRRVEQYHERFTNQTICGGIGQLGHSNQEVVWLRGGGVYYFYFSRNVGASPQPSDYTIYGQTASVTSSAVNAVWDSGTGAHTSYNNSVFADTEIQSPIFKDRNNTNYYLDLDGASRLYGLTIINSFDTASADVYANMRVIRNSVSGGLGDGMFIGYGNSNSGITRIYGGGATGGQLEKHSDFTQESTAFRAPVFQDSNNTNYYCDPAGTSQLVAITTGATGVYNTFNTWTNLPGYHGFYSSVHNGAHFYPNNGSYGSWRIDGSRNGWNGIEFAASNGSVTMMINPDSNTSGFHNNNYGWQMRWANGTGYIHKNAYGGGTEATIWDSVNLTNLNQLANGPGYITGYTETDTLATVTGRGFVTRASSGSFAVGDQANPGLEIYGAGGSEPAFMTFHRPGYYAIKLGLDGSDLKVGGWSMGAVAYTIWHTGNLTNLNQLSNGPGYTTNTGTVTSVATGTGLTGGTITTSGTISLTNTGVVAGSYTTANITVDAQGRITAASTGSAGSTVTVSDDTSTNATRYLVLEDITSGTASSLIVSSTKLSFNPSTGNLTVGGSVTANSDARIKTDVQVIDNPIAKIKQIRGVTFTRTDLPGSVRQTGVIAQEVKAVLPEAVFGTESTQYTVAYGNMVGLLIEAIKQQQSEIDELKSLVKQLLAK